MLRYTGSALTNNCFDERPNGATVYLDVDAGPPAFHADTPSPPQNRRGPKALSSPSALVTKLEAFVALAPDEIDALEALALHPKTLRAGQVVIHEGAAADHVCLIVQGFACRYKLLHGGRRQIMGYLIPGDLCDVHFTMFNRPDHSVVLISDAEVVKIPTQKFMSLTTAFPNVQRALSLCALVECAVLREWLLNIGQRDAMQRLSHFFCEMSVRMEAIRRIHQDGSFELPINQATLADTIGLTPVHINRTLQKLRNDGLIALRQRRLTILDADRLAAIAGFDRNYLRTN